MDLQELAGQVLDYFHTFTRPSADVKPDAELERHYALKNYRPVWLKDMMFKIHEDGHFFPDDFKYDTTVEVLDALHEGQDPDELNLEADPYNSDLLAWLGSHLERAGYVDEAVKDVGHSEQGVMGDIGLGQWWEKTQIAHIVVEALKEELEQIELGEPQQMEDVHEAHRREGPKEWSPRHKKKRGK